MYVKSDASCTGDALQCLVAADCIVLPSLYREGTPRSLLEAGASSRPVITTYMPGCGNTVDDCVSGVTAQADRMTRVIEIAPRRRATKEWNGNSTRRS
jgi:glycosyltransferase involved in cell wall biosynthesis